tara:strand:- start:975 stop:2867 length:1893 start_codon:yes stop_codon:yes gene_type:complete
MKKLQFALVLLLTISVLVILAIFAAPTFINWQNNKGIVENLASDFLGHRVHINGDLQVQLLPNPKIYAEDIIIDSVSGGEKIAEIEHVVLTKQLSDVFLLNMSVDEMVVNRPKVTFITDAGGSNNWEPLKVKNSSYYSRKVKNAVIGLVNFKHVVFENASVSYINELEDKTTAVTNIYADLNTTSSIIELKGSSIFNEVEQKMRVKLDISRSNAIKLDSSVSNQEYMVSLKGLVSNPYNFKRAQFVGRVESEFEDGNKLKFNKTISDLMQKYVDLKQLKFSADVTASKNKFDVSMIDLDSKYNTVRGNVSYDGTNAITDLDFKLEMDKLYIKAEDNAPVVNSELKWSEDPLDFSFANNLRVNASLSCSECTYGNMTFYQVNLKSTLENSNLIVNQFNLKANDKGYIKLSATAGLNAPFAFETKMELNEFPLYMLVGQTIKNKAEFLLNGGANFSASGSTEKDVFSNLTGSFDLDLVDLELKGIDDSSVKGFVDGILFNKNRVKFDSKVGEVELKGSVRDGVLRNTDTYFDLSGEEIIAKGKFDLANLTANYRIEPTDLRRNNLGVVISGNINNLEVTSDKITPKGVVDGFNRLVTTSIVKKAKRKEVKTPFDFQDTYNLEKNVKDYLFEK